MLAGLSLFAGAPAVSATAEAEARFAEARQAFEAEKFAAALALYEQALALGMQGPAVHYNIGVAAYRADDLARAESAFHEVARTPSMAALAHYNLGLVALRRADPRAAREHFERAARDAADERLASLAARRLAELPAAAPPPAWSFYIRGGVGYDDNVALRSDSIDGSASGEDDAFAELLASGSVAFGQGWHVDGAAARLVYGELGEFDQEVLSIGARRGFPLGAWYVEAGGHGTRLSLGDEVFERSVAASARAVRELGGRGLLQLRLRVTSVDGEGDFSGLTGGRAELGASYDWNRQAWSFTVFTRAEINESEDDVFASRWLEAGSVAGWALSPHWTFTAAGTLRRTRHPAQEGSADPWHDNRTTVRLGAIGKFWRQAQLFVRFEHERNTSPLEAYDYRRNWVAASIEYWR